MTSAASADASRIISVRYSSLLPFSAFGGRRLETVEAFLDDCREVASRMEPGSRFLWLRGLFEDPDVLTEAKRNHSESINLDRSSVVRQHDVQRTNGRGAIESRYELNCL